MKITKKSLVLLILFFFIIIPLIIYYKSDCEIKILNNITRKKIGGNFIKPNEVWELRISWLEDVNLDKFVQCDLPYHYKTLPLSRGKYETEFKSKFTFSDFETDTLSFNYEFEVK